MTLRYLLSAIWVACVIAVAGPALAQGEISPAPQFTPLQQEQIRGIMREYLLENPEVIYEAIQILQQRQQAEQKDRQRLALSDQHDQLFNSPTDPTFGGDNADVIVVEFFDYKCQFCKKTWPTLAKLLDEDRGVRLVYKEFPILGEDSVYAARASLAVHRQDEKKYKKFHEALMRASGTLTEKVVMAVAKSVGIDTGRLKESMQDEEINTIIEGNLRLAQSLGISGTPTIIIGDQVIPGAVNLKTMQAYVRAARAG